MTQLMEKKIIPIIMRTRDAGQREYAQSEDNVFANFDRVAKAINSTRE